MTQTQIAQTLTDALQLALPPVAVCLTDAVPSGVPMWDGRVPAGCQFWELAATETFATTARDHDLCSIGLYTHNLETTPASDTDLADALSVFGELGYVRDVDLPQIPVLASRPKHVVYGPLADVPVAPDVVLLFVKASQILILSEASQQLEGGLPPAMGRPACAVVPQALNTGRTALSLGCCGARAYLDALTDDVALYAIPGARLEAYTERLATLAKANSVLSAFHQIRKKDVIAGRTPTVKESLAALQAGGQAGKSHPG